MTQSQNIASRKLNIPELAGHLEIPARHAVSSV